MQGSISDIQDEIIEEFSFLGDDRESTIFYIMELGQKLPALDEKYKVEENIIKGCQSKVWLHAKLEGDRVVFEADSNTEITTYPRYLSPSGLIKLGFQHNPVDLVQTLAK